MAREGDAQAQADVEHGEYLADRYLVPAMSHNRHGTLPEQLARALEALRMDRQGAHRS
jgi:hypothetical protein